MPGAMEDLPPGRGARTSVPVDNAIASATDGVSSCSSSVPAPALDRAVGPDAAGVERPGADRREHAVGWRGLAIEVQAPALDGAIGTESAGVLTTGTDRGERACGPWCEPTVLITPAGERAVGSDAARVPFAGAYLRR